MKCSFSLYESLNKVFASPSSTWIITRSSIELKLVRLCSFTTVILTSFVHHYVQFGALGPKEEIAVMAVMGDPLTEGLSNRPLVKHPVRVNTF